MSNPPPPTPPALVAEDAALALHEEEPAAGPAHVAAWRLEAQTTRRLEEYVTRIGGRLTGTGDEPLPADVDVVVADAAALPLPSGDAPPPVIAVVADGDDVDARTSRAHECGADEVLVEPFGDAELAVRMEGVWRRATADRERQAAREDVRRSEGALSELAIEQVALRRVTMAVAAGESLSEVCARVAEQAVAVLGCAAAHVVFREEDGPATVVGAFAVRDGVEATVGPLRDRGVSATSKVLATGRPARNDDHGEPTEVGAGTGTGGWRSSAAVPVVTGGALWGAVGAVNATPHSLPTGAVRRLTRFAELVALAVGNARTSAQTRRLALRDHLTGLTNRRAFENALATECAQNRRHGTPLSVLAFDVDHFKRINDTHGHPVGDTVLVELARRMEATARVGETVARIGGEEFAILLPRVDITAAAAAAERVRAEVCAEPFPVVGEVTVSVGAAQATLDGDPLQVLRTADEALYRAKAEGRNRVCVAPAPSVVAATAPSEDPPARP